MNSKVKAYEVRFFNVGNETKGGDAILIRLLDNNNIWHVVIVDGGYKENGDRIVRYLVDECNINFIDIIFNTHPDVDHISGLIEIFNSDEVKVGKLIMNRPWRDANLNVSYFKDGRITEDSLEGRLKDSFKKAFELEQVALKKISESNIVSPIIGNTYFDCITILGPSTENYRKYLLASDKTPDAKDGLVLKVKTIVKKAITFVKYQIGTFVKWNYEEQTSPINETSVVLWLSMSNWDFLLTGDVGKDGLNDALDYFERVSGHESDYFNIVQLPHHGSRKNVSPLIFRRLGNIEYIISCPPDGYSTGHPSKRMINRLLQECPQATIHVTQNAQYIYYEGLNINLKVVPSLRQFSEMDAL